MLTTLIVLATNSLVVQRPDPDYKPVVASPAYEKTHPVVFIDGAHRNTYHLASGYKPLGELLTADGYAVKDIKVAFSPESLSTASVLVLANPRGPGTTPEEWIHDAFGKGEQEALVDWVKGGGSLLLVAEHPPMGDAAASLAQKFGVSVSKGFVEDEKNRPAGLDEVQFRTIAFSKKNGLLGDHAIVKGRPGRKEEVSVAWTFMGQAIKGPADSVPFLRLSSTAVNRIPNNGDESGALTRIVLGAPQPIAGWAQGIAMPFGKGRLVVLGEAAMLSAERAMNEEGKYYKSGMNVAGIENQQLALNILHWLSRLDEEK